MSEFTELDVQKDIDEMSESELRTTLTDFIDKHRANVDAYDELQTEFDDTVSEKDERIESLEERVDEFKQKKAAEAAEYVKMPEGILAERFSFAELEQIIEEAEEAGADGEFSEDEDTSEDADDEDEALTEFADRPPKGQRDSERPSEFRDRAKSRLASHGLPTDN
jgi:hypothetical protein